MGRGRSGFETAADDQRGFDHGTFIPLKVTYPAADVPTVQLSLKAGLDPAEHLAMGRALAPLRDEGVFILGSGMTYHNLRNLRDPSDRQAAETFDAWVRETATAEASEREHLLPLMVVAGAAGDDRGSTAFNGSLMGKRHSGFHFG